MNNNISPEQIKEAANRLSTAIRIVELQTNLINFVPSVRRVSKEEMLLNYTYLDKALTNIHELNQDLVSDMDNIAVMLDDIAESMEQ